MRKSVQFFPVVGIIVITVIGLWSNANAQLSGGVGGGGTGGGIPAIQGTPFGGATDPSLVPMTDGFRIIPSITAGERYDSNVYFVPPVAGVDMSDYVTTVAPQIRGLYSGSEMKLNATVGAVGEYYVKNTTLNYIGANAALALDLSPMVSRLWRGTQLTINETFRYTPQAPAFVTGDLQGDPLNLNPYSKGFQVGRADTTNNSIGANVIVPVTQIIDVTARYSYSLMKFGQSEAVQSGQLLNTTVHTYSVGTTMKFSPQDILNVNILGSEAQYQGSGSFTTRGAMLGWTHKFSPGLSLVSNAGGQIVEGQFPGTPPISPTLGPVGNISLTWWDNTTALSLAYGISITPSIQFSAAPLLTNNASFTVAQVTAIPELIALLGVNYGRGNEFGSTSSTEPVSFTSYGGTGGFNYRFSPKTFLSLTYSYSNFDSEFSGQKFTFDRQVVQLNLAVALY